MPLQFNPPEWLIQEYMNRKRPQDELADTLHAITSQQLQRKYQENKMQQDAQGNLLKAIETDPALLNTPMGQKLLASAGAGSLQGYTPPGASTGTTPAPTAGSTPTPGGSPIIAHFQQLMGRGRLGRQAAQDMKTGLEAQMLQRNLDTDPNAPVPVMSEEDALAAGQVSPKAKIIPSRKGSSSVGGPTGLTPAEKSVDQAFGKDYAAYVAGGGYADTEKQIKQLEDVQKKLASGKGNLTGPGISALPDAARSRMYPDSVSAQQQVEDSIQRSLRAIMGPQFTEKEGVMFMQRGYDTRLPEPTNATKIGNLVGQLRKMAKAKQAAADYYEKNGTLKGYKGPLNFGDIGSGEGESTTAPGGGGASTGPHGNSVTQNGVTYTWNQATGQYE